jgi:UDP-N-acetylglucosamine 3-dehydrogenase
MLRLDLGLVDVVTPTLSHAPLSIRALEAGHNVLVEKPMALSSKEALDMIEAARKNGRTLCVDHNKLFFRTVMQAKAAVEEGSMTVSQMRISHHFAYKHVLQNWRLSDESGGILWDAVVHPVYLTAHFLGPVTSVYALARKIEEPVFDSFILVLQNQRMGTIDYFWNAKYPLLELQVLGEDGDCYHAELVHDIAVKRSGD